MSAIDPDKPLIPSTQHRLELAEGALLAAGFTRQPNASWKPPLGKPIGPVLESLDDARADKNQLAEMLLKLVAAALPHMPTDEDLRCAGIEAVNMVLAVMEGRSL